MSYRDELLAKIKTLSDTVWHGKAKESEIDAWLDNFVPSPNGSNDERTHALYLLSQFMYFGDPEMRELMRVLFRDLYKYPIVEYIRKSHKDTTDTDIINHKFSAALERTLFLGVGNPSESGYHLLYYFRQENSLPKTRFIHSHQVFERKRLGKLQILKTLFSTRRDRFGGTLALRQPDINQYVFIDDFCGSGHQGEDYSRDIVEDIKSLNPTIKVSYFVLFATTKGMDFLRKNTAFDVVRCVFELDESFQCFSSSSRYFPSQSPEVSPKFAEQTCRKYGVQLVPSNPLGYGNGQLLIGFHHNTPDNTLPIFWYDEPGNTNWTPIFKRYQKYYR